MTSIVVNVTQVRDNLAEILGRVKFGEEIVTIEKKGKPYAVIMSTQEYTRYKEVARKAFQATLANIQAKNANVREEEVMEDVIETVEDVHYRTVFHL
jgi:prevent-host-death family protein